MTALSLFELRVRPVLSALVLLYTPGIFAIQVDAAPLHHRPPAASVLNAMDKIIEDGIRSRVFPGAVLAVGTAGSPPSVRAYGRHTYDPDSPPVRPDTIYDLASVTKVAGTTAAALLMIQEGRMSLRDRVGTFIPAFAGTSNGGITLRQLLTHTSGLKPYENRERVEQQRLDGETAADALMRHYAGLERSYESGLGSRYSCLNMQVAARAVEEAAGQSLDTLLKRRVWRPLGMKDTGYLLTDEQKLRCAPIAAGADGPVRGKIHDPLANYHGAGDHCPGNAGLYSTAPDLARYCGLLLGGGELDNTRVYEPWAVALATTAQNPTTAPRPRAIGWGIYTRPPYATSLNSSEDTRILGHTGYTGTWIWMDKLSGSYIVLLSNRVYPTTEREPENRAGVGDIQEALAEAMLKSIPRYREYFRTPGQAASSNRGS